MVWNLSFVAFQKEALKNTAMFRAQRVSHIVSIFAAGGTGMDTGTVSTVPYGTVRYAKSRMVFRIGVPVPVPVAVGLVCTGTRYKKCRLRAAQAKYVCDKRYSHRNVPGHIVIAHLTEGIRTQRTFHCSRVSFLTGDFRICQDR